MKNIRMAEMNWVDIGEAIRNGFTTVVIGIGSTEQHGPHLPTHTDTMIGDFLANRIALKLENALQAQTIRIGCSDHHLSFSGTISFKEETLMAIIYDYVESLSYHGFNTIIFIPSHGGNFEPTQKAIVNLTSKHPELKIIGCTDMIKFINYEWDIAKEFGINYQIAGAHAGEVETSQMLAISTSQVIKERFKPGYLGELDEEKEKLIFEKGIYALSKIGVIGDPSSADKERGKIYLDKLVDYLVQDIKEQLH
ncbi:MAG: creatininase family protein [Promethearchaeota archaeon]